MKRLCAVMLLCGFAGSAGAQGKSGDFGFGVGLGDVTGPTIKYFVGPTTALQLALGFSSDFDVAADFVFHNWDIMPRPQKGIFGAYLAVGPRFEEQDDDNRRRRDRDDELGLRTLVGIDYWVQEVPVELFFEVGPWFVFTPDTDTEIDLGIGLRYYFNKR